MKKSYKVIKIFSQSRRWKIPASLRPKYTFSISTIACMNIYKTCAKTAIRTCNKCRFFIFHSIVSFFCCIFLMIQLYEKVTLFLTSLNAIIISIHAKFIIIKYHHITRMIPTNCDSHHPNISPVISGYKRPSKSAQSIEINGFIEKSKPPEIIFYYTLLPLTA